VTIPLKKPFFFNNLDFLPRLELWTFFEKHVEEEWCKWDEEAMGLRTSEE